LELLDDGKWHAISEIQRKTELDEITLREIIAFLKEYNFVTANDAKDKIRVNNDYKEFLTETTTS
jgi:DNA-binding IclR family transcriptional regulator